MWKAPKIWPDGRCFIVGGGNSLWSQLEVPEQAVADFRDSLNPGTEMVGYLDPLKLEHTIGINMAYTFGAAVMDVVFFGDIGFWNRRKFDLLDFKGLRVTCATGMPKTSRVKVLERDSKSKGITTNPSRVCWNANSGAAAINLAVHFGAKQIILLGFDMNSSSADIHHWHRFYGNRELTKQNKTYAKHLQGFPVIAEDAKKLGVEILNANPHSAIDCFRKVSLKEVL